MKIILLTLSMIVFLLAVTVSCGSEKKGGETDDEAAAVSPEDSIAMYYDSLAAVRPEVRDPENPIVTLETSYGNLTLELYRDVAPAHADSFVARSKEGFYDSTVFHRVIERFMIQGGDPTGTGAGQPSYYLQAEFSDLPHLEGTLSMARVGGNPNSASTQFFICLERNRMTASLDKQYTIFGHLLKGYDVLHRIGSVPCVANPGDPREISKPAEDVYLLRAYLSDAEGIEL